MTVDRFAPLEIPGFRYEPRTVRPCPHDGCEWSVTTEALITRKGQVSVYRPSPAVLEEVTLEHLETHLDPSVRYR